MKLYQLVWLFLLTYMGYKCGLSVTGKGSFFGTSLDGLYEDSDGSGNVQYSKNTTSNNKNSYLVLIGTETNKYGYFYQPETVILSFGGTRRDIFEKTLLRLNLNSIFTVVSSDSMKAKVLNDITNKNVSNRWYVLQSSSRKNSNHIGEIKKVFGKLQMNRPSVVFSDMTIVFDIGDFPASYLKSFIHSHSKSVSQFIIYNRKKPMTNLKSIRLMMQRAGYRYLNKVKSQYIATFVSKKSSLWK